MVRVAVRTLMTLVVSTILVSCQVEAMVDIRVDDDGSGTVTVSVTLDDEAQAYVPDLGDELATDDLVAAGWTVEPPMVASGGLERVAATKPFANPDEFAAVMQELSGGQIFGDFRLLRDRSFARTTWRVEGTVDWAEGGDPASGLDDFSDPALAATLFGQPLGYSIEQLEDLADAPLADAAVLTVRVRLPDSADGDANQLSGDVGTWTIRLDDGTPTSIAIEGSVDDTAPRFWAAVAVIAGGLALVYVVVTGLSFVARRAGLRAETRAQGPTEIVETPANPVVPRERRLELVVLGGIGVVFDPGDGVDGLLRPFVRSSGSTADDVDLAMYHRSASLGHLNAAEFWAAVGAPGDPDDLDRAYLSRVRLNAGLLPFLERVESQGLEIACVTNAVLGWMNVLMSRFELDEHIGTWIVSSDVGARKPSHAIFEALRRSSGVPYENCMMIDTSLDALRVARDLGMSTVLFAHPGVEVPEDAGFTVIRSFEDLFAPVVTS